MKTPTHARGRCSPDIVLLKLAVWFSLWRRRLGFSLGDAAGFRAGFAARDEGVHPPAPPPLGKVRPATRHVTVSPLAPPSHHAPIATRDFEENNGHPADYEDKKVAREYQQLRTRLREVEMDQVLHHCGHPAAAALHHHCLSTHLACSLHALSHRRRSTATSCPSFPTAAPAARAPACRPSAPWQARSTRRAATQTQHIAQRTATPPSDRAMRSPAERARSRR